MQLPILLLQSSSPENFLSEYLGPILAVGILAAFIVPWLIREIRETRELNRMCGPGCICGGENRAQANQEVTVYVQQPPPNYPHPGPQPQVVLLQAPPQQPAHYLQPHHRSHRRSIFRLRSRRCYTRRNNSSTISGPTSTAIHAGAADGLSATASADFSSSGRASFGVSARAAGELSPIGATEWLSAGALAATAELLRWTRSGVCSGVSV